MAMNEDGVPWKGGPALDDEGKIDHSFMAFVSGDLQRGVGVLGVNVIRIWNPATYIMPCQNRTLEEVLCNGTLYSFPT